MKEYELSSNNQAMFSLHDCRAKSAKYEGQTLTLYFPEGIFCRNYGRDWPNTGRSAVSVTAEELQILRFVQKGPWTVREEIPVKTLVENLCAGKWQLELGCRYDGCREILYTGWLWQEKKPYSTECQLLLGTDTVTYRWDPPKQCRE